MAGIYEDDEVIGVIEKEVNQNGVMSIGKKYAGMLVRAYIVKVDEV